MSGMFWESPDAPHGSEKKLMASLGEKACEYIRPQGIARTETSRVRVSVQDGGRAARGSACGQVFRLWPVDGAGLHNPRVCASTADLGAAS